MYVPLVKNSIASSDAESPSKTPTGTSVSPVQYRRPKLLQTANNLHSLYLAILRLVRHD